MPSYLLVENALKGATVGREKFGGIKLTKQQWLVAVYALSEDKIVAEIIHSHDRAAALPDSTKFYILPNVYLTLPHPF